MQILSSIVALDGHLAILISHTGENAKLIELIRLLRRNKRKTIVITIGKDTTMAKMADEFLYAPGAYVKIGDPESAKLGIPLFTTAAKYLLDLIFAIAFNGQYTENVSLDQRYTTIGMAKFW